MNHRLINSLVLVLVLVLTAGITFYQDQWLNWFSDQKIHPYSKLIFTDDQGKAHRIPDYHGKVVLVHVWASWCPPCISEFPDLVAYLKRNPQVILLAVSVDSDAQAMRSFWKRFELNSHTNAFLIPDPDRLISQDQLAVEAYPETLFFDKKGYFYKHIKGILDWKTLTFH